METPALDRILEHRILRRVNQAEAAAELSALKQRAEDLEAALQDALRSWSFDDGQAHTHTWHDKADWMARNRKALQHAE